MVESKVYHDALLLKVHYEHYDKFQSATELCVYGLSKEHCIL
jgi:hypothetical protein